MSSSEPSSVLVVDDSEAVRGLLLRALEGEDYEVVAVGPGRIDDNGNRVPLDIAVGDKVIYSKYGGTEVKYGGDDLLVLSARDVLAVVVR